MNPRQLVRSPDARMRHTLRLSTLLAVFLLTACDDTSGPAPDNVIDREVFVATYVDLRVAALTDEGGELSDADRAAVLEEHGVTEEQLLGFVEYHAAELTFMRDVWNDVELALDAERPRVDEVR